MKIAEAIKSNEFWLGISYGTRRLVGNDAGDGFRVLGRPRYARVSTMLYEGNDEDAAVAALLGDDAEECEP